MKKKFALGKDGVVVAALASAAATLLAGAASGMILEPWAPSAAAAAGIGAGLLGCIGIARRARQPAPPVAPKEIAARRDDAMDNMAALLRSMAEEMVRLKRDGADASRSMADARQASTRIVEAAATAIARLDESAESSAIAARALSMLPGIADTHAQRIEFLAARAEQALALVPDAMAGAVSSEANRDAAVIAAVEVAMSRHIPTAPVGLEAAIARLESLPGEVGAAMHAGLLQQHPAEAAMLEATIARLEATRPDPMLAVGLMEATERLESIAHQLEAAAPARDAPAPHLDPEALAGQLHAALAPSLAEVLSRRLTAIADAASRDRTGSAEFAEVLGARLDATLDRVSGDVARQLGITMTEWESRQPPQPDPGALLDDVTGRLEAAAASIAGLAEGLPEAVSGATAMRLDANIEDFRARCVQIIETLPEAIASGMEQRLAALAEALPEAVRVTAAAQLDTHAEDLRMRCARIVDALPEAITASVEQRFAILADALAAASAGFPAAAEGLQSHLVALETLGPVLDSVTERLIETAEALALTGGSLEPMADSARRAVDALSLAVRDLAHLRLARPLEPRPAAARRQEAPQGSAALSSIGQRTEQEGPAMAGTLHPFDGSSGEVAPPLSQTEGMDSRTGGGTISRPVIKPAPAMLENLQETIRGLQSISTAIAAAAERRLDHAQVS